MSNENNTPTASPENEARFSIDEREDDMLIGERHWQFGWRCIARRPKLITNDEWRPEAERIVAALANLSPASEPASGDVQLLRDFEALRRDYGRAALLIEIMRERWEVVSNRLNHIEGGMHADLEDAASAMASVCDDPKGAILAALASKGESAAIEATGEGLALEVGERFLNACFSAWAAGEPTHRVRTMCDLADEFRDALNALKSKDPAHD